jgi:hypothetical protein
MCQAIASMEVGRRVEIAAYLRGRVRERPDLLRNWPMFVLGREWKPLPDRASLGQFAWPDACDTMAQGECKAGRAGRAHLPFHFWQLNEELPDARHNEWDYLIWAEVRRALDRVVQELELELVLNPARSGMEHASKHHASTFYSCRNHFNARLDRVEAYIKEASPTMEGLRELTRGDGSFERLRGMDFQVSSGIDWKLWTIAIGAISEGATSLVALASVFLRIGSYGICLTGTDPNQLWQDACRRLYCQAWESVGGIR